MPGWKKYEGEIGVRVYVPPGEDGERKVWPVHFNFHGGGKSIRLLGMIGDEDEPWCGRCGCNWTFEGPNRCHVQHAGGSGKWSLGLKEGMHVTVDAGCA